MATKKENTGGRGFLGFTSMKSEMLAVIIPIVTAMVVILIAVSYNVSKNMIKKTSEELLKSSAASQAAKINSWVEQKLGTLSAVKKGIETGGYTDAELAKVLEGYYGFDSDFPEGIYVASSDGSTFKPSLSGKQMDNFKDQKWYTHGLTTVDLSITEPYIGSDGNRMISATGMLLEQGNTVRVIGADMTLDAVTIIVNSSISMDGASAFLVDTNDMAILAHRDSSLLGAVVGSTGDSFLKGVAGKLQSRDYSLADIGGNMTFLKKVGSTGWVLVSYIPDDVIFADSNKLGTIMLLIGFVAVVAISVIIARVIRFLVKPIGVLTGNIAEMSSGNFTIRTKTSGKDEIARMGQSLDGFSGTMRDMIADIRQTADNLSAQSENSSNAATEMYEAAKIQGDSMDQLKETVNQLTVSVNDIAENATVLANVVAETRNKGNDADAKMKTTVDVSVKAKAEMEEVGVAMDKILSNMASLQEAINRVGAASEEITKIIGLIGEIAEETNLLSLNASIEAARAGEAGKGFAVVASEIGKLAATSTDSVNTISGLISQIGNLVKDAMDQADNSAKNINESSGSIKGAADTFDEIYSNIQATNTLINEVLVKIGEVDGVATNMAAVTQEQAASSEEILATSETMVEQAKSITENSQIVANDSIELAKTSESLSEHMSRFRIDESEA